MYGSSSVSHTLAGNTEDGSSCHKYGRGGGFKHWEQKTYLPSSLAVAEEALAAACRAVRSRCLRCSALVPVLAIVQATLHVAARHKLNRDAQRLCGRARAEARLPLENARSQRRGRGGNREAERGGPNKCSTCRRAPMRQWY